MTTDDILKLIEAKVMEAELRGETLVRTGHPLGAGVQKIIAMSLSDFADELRARMLDELQTKGSA